MSYKVYDGFKFKATDMDAVRHHVDDWCKTLAVLHRHWLARLHANMVASIVDEAATSGRHDGKVPIDAVRTEILQRQQEIVKSQHRDPKVDPEFSVSVFTHPTGYYGIVRTERREWLDEWLKSDFVEDFCYWNNTDRPRGMRREEWDDRHSVWKSLASSRAEVLDCTPVGSDVEDAEVVAAMPTVEARVAREARRITELGEFERLANESKPDGDEAESDRFQRLISIASGLPSWLNSDEGAAGIEETSARVRAVVAEIDEKMMQKRIGQVGLTSRLLSAPSGC
ncbi:hypothetical protein [Rhizobium sp. BK176]|uniref:hypothetical protein n=1 Tax=Rhizobium sp. BK176 TaxID=2587071 RepID=UPI00216989AB|nr:hypothetical protein [Rhizobium sp. BK176]MCS4089430.1 hypothetical protein [Rhizobium sp. BK176]